MEKFYQFKIPKEESGVTELFIYGDITSCIWEESDTSSFNFANELAEVNGDLVVHINSYGGEVAEGLAIYNLLKSFKGTVTTICDGFACSIASVIFLAGTERIMNEGSLYMIHNAWSGLYGNANDFRKQADDLDKITSASIEIYKANSNLHEDVIKNLLDNESWLTPNEALEYGFATSIKKLENAKQSLHDQCLKNQVLKTKELEYKLNELKQATAPEVKTGWDAFFNI